MRTRRDHVCNTAQCSSSITRTIWDGDQVLAEIRADGGNVGAGTLEDDRPSGSIAYGQVLYTHAGGIDRPLSLIRSGYTPSGLGAAYEFDRWGGPWAMIPYTDYRGTYFTGTVANGRQIPCDDLSATCTLVEWPGASRIYYSQYQVSAQQSWFGSLITGSADASGLMYRRNRYYNPATGSFTQSDPIGIAGGLNTYGYVGGDPVMYSDPFGLCFPWPGCLVRQAAIRISTQAGEDATRAWADAAERTTGPARGVNIVMGHFSALWTPDTYERTANVIQTALEIGEDVVRDAVDRPSSPNQMNNDPRMPGTVERVDRAFPGSGDSQPHIHFKRTRATLNRDGTWGHGGEKDPPSLTNAEMRWIEGHGWATPPQ